MNVLNVRNSSYEDLKQSVQKIPDSIKQRVFLSAGSRVMEFYQYQN